MAETSSSSTRSSTRTCAEAPCSQRLAAVTRDAMRSRSDPGGKNASHIALADAHEEAAVNDRARGATRSPGIRQHSGDEDRSEGTHRVSVERGQIR